MEKECLHIIKSRAEEDSCSLCGTSIEKGENCLVIFSRKGDGYQNVKFHLDCIPALIETIELITKEAVIKSLKGGKNGKKI